MALSSAVHSEQSPSNCASECCNTRSFLRAARCQPIHLKVSLCHAANSTSCGQKPASVCMALMLASREAPAQAQHGAAQCGAACQPVRRSTKRFSTQQVTAKRRMAELLEAGCAHSAAWRRWPGPFLAPGAPSAPAQFAPNTAKEDNVQTTTFTWTISSQNPTHRLWH